LLVRYADDFVFLNPPGRGQKLHERLHRWHAAKGAETQ
jgi:hypothetical protein